MICNRSKFRADKMLEGRTSPEELQSFSQSAVFGPFQTQNSRKHCALKPIISNGLHYAMMAFRYVELSGSCCTAWRRQRWSQQRPQLRLPCVWKVPSLRSCYCICWLTVTVSWVTGTINATEFYLCFSYYTKSKCLQRKRSIVLIVWRITPL